MSISLSLNKEGCDDILLLFAANQHVVCARAQDRIFVPMFPNHGILNQGHQCASGEIHINCIDEFGMSWLNM